MTIDGFKRYYTEEPKSNYITPIILFALVYFFKSALLRLTATITDVLFKDFSTDWLTNILCLLAVFLGVAKLIRNITKGRYPSLLAIFSWALIVIGYLFIYRGNSQIYFFKLFDSQLYLTDCLLFGSLLFFSPYIYIGQRIQSNPALQLSEDNPDTVDAANDKLSRSAYAEHIAKVVSATVPQKALAISVTAEWGYGKTTFMRFVESTLKNDSNNIIVHFNPWKYEKSGQMLAHFFEALESEFEAYDDRVVSSIKDYADKLTEVDDSTLTKILKQSIATVVGGERTLTDRYEALNKAIIRSGKRIVVFIDDLDRLVADELISVVRLIRNTADFTNTFFIAAFDQNYVLNALASARHATNKENFLQKIFQLEISLPPIRKDIIEESIREYLQLDLMSIDEKNRFDQVLPNKNDHISTWNDIIRNLGNDNPQYSPKVRISQFLHSIRDVKRFTNSFKLSYITIGSEVDLYDLITVELIKYRFPSIYTLIAEEKVLSQYITGIATWRLDEKKLETYLSEEKLRELNILVSQVSLIRDVLKQLFDENRIRTNRTIINQSNFHLYFQYQLFGSISIDEFNKARRNGRVTMIEYFQKVLADKKLDQLLDYIDRIIAFDSKTEFEDVVHCLLFISAGNDIAAIRAGVLLIREEFNIKTYYNGNKIEYDNYLQNTLQDNQYKNIVRGPIAYELLQYHLRDQQPKVLTQDFLKSLLLQLLKETINNEPQKEDIIYTLYTYNWDYIEEGNRRVHLNQDANRLLRNYFNSHNQFFIYHLLRPKLTPNIDNEYVFDPFIPQIFGSYDEFERFTVNLEESDCKVYLLKQFAKFKENEYTSITINDFESNPCRVEHV